MSVRLMSILWERYPAGGSELLLMLALADWADDDGNRIYPSVATLAKKVRQSERNVQRLLRKLVKSRLLEVVGSERGGSGRTTHYRIPVERVTSLHPLLPERVTSRASKGDTQGQKGDIAMSPDPSVEPSKNRVCTHAVPECPHEQIVMLYHKYMPTCPPVRRLHHERRDRMQAFWNEHPDLDWWDRFFTHASTSDLLTGRKINRNGDKSYPTHFDYLISEAGFTAVIEGHPHLA